MVRRLWTQRSDFGPPPSEGTMVYDEDRDHMLLLLSDANQGSTWRWDGNDWIQLADTGPVLAHLDLAFDTGRKRLVCHGAIEGQEGQTWEWHDEAWTQVSRGADILLRHRL